MKAIPNGLGGWKSERCIYHRTNKATRWFGHMHKKGQIETAPIVEVGFCSKECLLRKKPKNTKSCSHCFGKFLRFEPRNLHNKYKPFDPYNDF